MKKKILPYESLLAINSPMKQAIVNNRSKLESEGLYLIPGNACIDMLKVPHVLVAGATGSGKSTLLHSLIYSVLCCHGTDTARLAMVDSKQIELTMYDGLPHCICPCATDEKQAARITAYLIDLMEKRYTDMHKKHMKTCTDCAYFLIIDELADIMLSGNKSLKTDILRLAQKARAANIHLILATQRINRQVINPLVSANIPGKLCLNCSRKTDYIVMLDHSAEVPLYSCMVKTSESEQLVKVPFLTEQDIQTMIRYWQ